MYVRKKNSILSPILRYRAYKSTKKMRNSAQKEGKSYSRIGKFTFSTPKKVRTFAPETKRNVVFTS